MKRALVLFSLLSACSSRSSRTAITETPPPPPSASPPPSAAPSASAPREVEDAGTEPADPEPSYDELVSALGIPAAACAPLAGDARARCAIDERYKADPKAGALANELWAKWRIAPGVEAAHTMDGGYRGTIRIEPAVPVNGDRKHIEWIALAMRDLDRFWTDLEKLGPRRTTKRYRFRPITLRFMRSMNGKRTPSAYAHDWTVAWNLEGSLHTSADAVRETLVHEIFHLNDRAHAATSEGWWSSLTLSKDYDAIVKKCGTALGCLAPYAPNGTIVRGGTYYAFQPGNGVVEYAAELALRYYREQRAVMRSLPREKPFKCGPPENARAWEAMKGEFFGGIDAVPPCGT